MDSFLENNKQKLRFAFKATSLIFLTIVFIILIFVYFNNQLLDFWLLLTVILTAGIGFPAFVVGLGYLNWRYMTRIREKNYRLSPFDKLEKIGFTKSFIYSETKWNFTEEIKAGKINDFQLFCDASPDVIVFTTLIEPLQLDRNEYKKLKKKLMQYNVYFNFESVVKLYRLKQMKTEPIVDLKKDLEDFTDLLKQENIKPRIKNGRA